MGAKIQTNINQQKQRKKSKTVSCYIKKPHLFWMR